MWSQPSGQCRDVSSNMLATVPPSAFARNTQLAFLNLQGNVMVNLPADMLSANQQLSVLLVS